MTDLIGKFSLEKHHKYKSIYEPNTLYWGLGIENELYLQFDKPFDFSLEKFLNNHKRERYSVDYFSNYKNNIVDEYLRQVDYSGKIPLLFNSHSFSKSDRFNNPRAIYSKVYEVNPDFEGITLWEFIEKNNEYLKNNYGYSFIFDGDTVEIITVNFFKTTLDKMIEEYKINKKKFIENVQEIFEKNNIFAQYGKIDYMTMNHPFAVHLTNTENMGMFNNGTLQFNVTLPTKLNNNGMIEDIKSFRNQHKNYIRLIQFMEPLFLAIYGEPDPLSKIPDQPLLFSACSQRNAISRYIGVGTYDTDKMIPGKILTDSLNTFKVATEDYGWHKKYYQYCGYQKLDYLGYDINFNKHYNHGVEIRFFEHLTDVEKIKEIGTMLIYLGDYALDTEVDENPILMEEWNNVVIRSMNFGKKAELSEKELSIYRRLFQTHLISTSISNLYYEILYFLGNKYRLNGKFSKYTLYDAYAEAENNSRKILENAELKAKEILLNATTVMEKAEKIREQAEDLADKIIREAEEKAKENIKKMEIEFGSVKKKTQSQVNSIQNQIAGIPKIQSPTIEIEPGVVIQKKKKEKKNDSESKNCCNIL